MMVRIPHLPRGDAGGGIYVNRFKRPLELVAASAAAVLLAPLIGVLALLVMLDGGAPFLAQERIGKDGRRFRMLKLRTMVPDAAGRLAAHLAAHPVARAEWSRDQKLRDDPRITRVGHVLRRYSLDEVPQLWNVLAGDMALIGPRPMMTDQCALYPESAYFALRPGITGLWQVMARNQSSFAERGRFDRDYLRRQSLVLDLWIIMRTLRAVVAGTGR